MTPTFKSYPAFKGGATLFCYLLALGIAWYSWMPLLNAQWGLIDDHEVMAFVGTEVRLPPSHFVEALKKTELNPESSLARFRPSFYVVRALESMAWGKNARQWYGLRIGIATILALTVAYIGILFAGPILAAGFLTFSLFAGYWADVFARAGPGETYAVLGVCLIGLLVGQLRKSTINLATAFGVAVGVMLAVGSKENFLVLVFLPIWLLYKEKVKVTSPAGLIMLSTIAYALWIGLTVYARVSAAGADVYANPVSLWSRLYLLKAFAVKPIIHIWAVAISISFIGAIAFWYFQKQGQGKHITAGVFAFTQVDGDLISLLRHYGFVQLGLLGIYSLQYFFYSGQWPEGSSGRYYFPGILARDLAILATFALVISILKLAKLSYPKPLTIEIALAAILVYIAPSHTLNRQASIETVQQTTAFFDKYTSIVSFLKDHPELPVIINTHAAFDFEPIHSIQIYLKSSGLKNRVSINAQNLTLQNLAPDSLERGLAGVIINLSRQDSSGRFVPLESVDQENCFSIGLSGPPLKACEKGVTVWPL